MTGTPLVSVIVPTYRRAAYLGETLDSVLAQTWAEFEVIVVEDGSHDAAEALAKHAGRVEYVWQPNQGAGVARNTGAARARADWLAFIDDDDLWAPDKLERQLAFAARAPEFALVHTDHHVLVDGDVHVAPRNPPRGQIPSGWVSAALMLSNFIVTSSVLVRRAEFERVGGFTSNRDWAEDLDLWLRLSRECQIGFLDEPLTTYRDHTRSVSTPVHWHMCRSNALEHFIRAYPAIRRELGGRALRRRMGQVYWRGAYDHLMHDEFATAARLFGSAWRWEPWRLRPLAYAVGCLTGPRGLAALRGLKRALR